MMVAMKTSAEIEARLGEMFPGEIE